jgi:hypothetical protein
MLVNFAESEVSFTVRLTLLTHVLLKVNNMRLRVLANFFDIFASHMEALVFLMPMGKGPFNFIAKYIWLVWMVCRVH